MKRMLIVTMALLVAGAGLAQAQTGASCVVRFEGYSSTLPVTPDMIDALAGSSGVVKAALSKHQDALRNYDAPIGDIIGVKFAAMHQQRDLIVGRLSVELYDKIVDHTQDTELANDLLHGICTQLRETLERTGRQDQEHLAQKLAAAEETLAAARAEMERVQQLDQELCASAGRYELHREAVVAEMEDLRREEKALEMSMQAMAARRDALARQIAEVAQRAEEKVAEDEVIAELEKVVELRQEELAEMLERVETGTVMRADAREAQEGVARARAELARERQEALQRAGAGWLDELSESLMAVSSELMEQAAELATVNARQIEMQERNLLELVNRYDRDVRWQREMAESAVREALRDVQKTTDQVRSYQLPRITVLGEPE